MVSVKQTVIGLNIPYSIQMEVQIHWHSALDAIMQYMHNSMYKKTQLEFTLYALRNKILFINLLCSLKPHS